MDQDSTFMSSLMNYLFNKLDIKIKTVTPYNHQSLQAKHRIKSLSMILMKHPDQLRSDVAKIFIIRLLLHILHLITQI